MARLKYVLCEDNYAIVNIQARTDRFNRDTVREFVKTMQLDAERIKVTKRYIFDEFDEVWDDYINERREAL